MIDEALTMSCATNCPCVSKACPADPPHSMAQLRLPYDLTDRRCLLVFGVGPTGTGKTYLTVATVIN
ncbi:MAG: PhoH family protein [Rhodobiaceae bacterium]|nr:PhoH family protein [Rhodobiaceae bacterium]